MFAKITPMKKCNYSPEAQDRLLTILTLMAKLEVQMAHTLSEVQSAQTAMGSRLDTLAADVARLVAGQVDGAAVDAVFDAQAANDAKVAAIQAGITPVVAPTP